MDSALYNVHCAILAERKGIFLYAKTSKPILVPIQPPIQWIIFRGKAAWALC
jgi:hypothetical protein